MESDGTRTFQPFIVTRSLAFESEANSAVNTGRPASAQNTPDATRNQSQQRVSADRVTPNDRPTGQSNRPATNRPATNRPATNRPATNRPATNNNTPQRTAPATNAVTPQPSNSLPQATTVHVSTPGATTAVLPQASTTGGAVGPNSQATVDHHHKPNVGAIVGGTLGALALLVILGAAAVKYLKGQSGNGAGGRGREEDVAVTQSLMGDFFQGGVFAGGVAGVGGQGAGSGKGGPGNKAAPGEGGSGAQGGDPEMTQAYNNHAPPPTSGSEQPGPSSQYPQQPHAGPYGHPVGGYGVGTGGAEGAAHGHGVGGGGHGHVPHYAGGGEGSYGNVAPGAGGGGGGGGGGGHAVGPANGGGGAGNAGAGGGGQAGAGGNAPTAPPGSGSGTGPVGTDVSNPGTYFDPTHGTIPPGSDIPPGAAGGHHGPGFIPVIVPVGARKRPTPASQSSLVNTLPTPYYMTGSATYDGGYPAGAVSSTSLVGGNTSGNERPSTDGGISRRYSLSDGLYGGPAYGRYEDPFEEGQGLLPSYEVGPGPAAAARRRNDKDYR
ncbi:hypothetical protein FRC05_003560 [Tulasnella sp. 425]|nr:hypothetical protein FRC05_003560 [Tulasnella sp. 425]